MQPIVQISLDVTTIEEAIQTAELALRAGVDWLEAGTPLILAEGLRAVRELRALMHTSVNKSLAVESLLWRWAQVRTR